MPKRSLIILTLLAQACGTPPAPAVSCTASTCGGCCGSSGECLSGTSTTSCGRLGLACTACQTGQSCVAGLCQGTATTGGGAAGGAGGSGGGAATAGGSASGGDAGGSAGGFTTAGGTAGGAEIAGGASGGGSTAGGTAAGGSATGGGMTTARSTQFSTTPLRFSVPEATYNALSFTTPGALSRRAWATIDLTNDGRVDLVVTSDPVTGAVFNNNGMRSWNVHAGTPSGFSAAATSFPVPGTASIAQGYNTTTSATGMLFWTTQDFNGDGRPDLAQTMNAVAGGPAISIGINNDGWLVYRGNATGFDATTTTFSVPRVTNLTGGVDRTTSDTASRRWALADVNADELPDLVITADPLTDAVWQSALGAAQWVICPGSPTGFGSFGSCQRLAVPDNGVAGGFKSATSIVPATRRVWLLTDLDGDGRDDLIQTANPLAITPTTFFSAFTPTWRVWFNRFGPTGLFATTPVQWAVPASTFATPFSATAPNFWQLMDLDGDGEKELVQTANPQTGRPFTIPLTGGASWRVYFQAGRAGFSATPTSWPIPVGPTPDGFRSASGTSWAVTDVTGDGLPDLVEFRDPLTNLAFTDPAGAFWRVYVGF